MPPGHLRPPKRELQNLRRVERPALGSLEDLLAAAEPVGDHEPVARGSAHFREEHALPYPGGDLIGFSGEAEGAGHPAAALRRPLGFNAQPMQQLHFPLEADHCMVVAMGLHQRATTLPWLGKTVEIAKGEIGEVDRLFG